MVLTLFVFEENAWCTAHGTHGSGWNLDWGTLAMSAVGGIDAFKACCACGGGGKNLLTVLFF